MKIYELAKLLSSKDFDEEAEILVETDEGLCDFNLADTEATFDGWDTYYPEGLKIIVKNANTSFIER